MFIKDNICFYNINNYIGNRITEILGTDLYNYYYLNSLNKMLRISDDIKMSLVIIDQDLSEEEKRIIDSFSNNTYTSLLMITDDESFDCHYASITNEEFLMYLIKTLCRATWVSRIKDQEIKKNISNEDSYIRTLDLIDKLDTYTKGHSSNVMDYSIKLAKALNLSEKEIYDVGIAALLHDIGKTVIPKELLMTPNKLTKNEYEIVKLHTTILDNIVHNEFQDLKDIIRHHHEKYDGSGYPDKIKGEDIPILSRIITVVDSYDAMTSKRLYNTPKSKEEAIETLIKDSNTHFDPIITKIFIDILKNE